MISYIRAVWHWTPFFIGLAIGLLSELLIVRLRWKAQVRETKDSDHTFDLETMRRALDGKDVMIARLEQQATGMRDEYQRLKEDYGRIQSEVQDQERVALYRALEPVLVQLPVIAADHNAGADVSASDVLGLVMTIPRRLQQMDITMLGTVGDHVGFDPHLHRPVPSSGSLEPGDPIRIVCPGFLYRDEVLTRAEIAREGS
jgi:molecular chaperone GrpE (heat shock protein)